MSCVSNALERNGFSRPGPVVVVVMDGIGIGAGDAGDAVHRARTPVLDRIWRENPTLQLKAHGTAVGMPSDSDMGNSEVGHNALGAGRIFPQGATLVAEAIKSGRLFKGTVWEESVRQVNSGGTLHLIGLLSDGNVHSHTDHLFALIDNAAVAGVRCLRVHVLLDGRDVDPQSAHIYVDQLEQKLAEAGSERDYRIASGGGRMRVTMDRYGADWSMVELGWDTHVLGKGPKFESAQAAIRTYRSENPAVSDQYLGAFVIADVNGDPVGPIVDGDAVILFNFRGDRAIEIAEAFTGEHFSAFERGVVPKVSFAGMTQYDGDRRIPKRYLVDPPRITGGLGERLAEARVRQFACSETQKYGHVTYFWNGNRSGKFSDTYEHYVEISSDSVPFEQRPWMKAAEITDVTIGVLQSVNDRPEFLRINYPNGDMVGHTGDLEAATIAVEATDLSLGRLLRVIDSVGGVALVTADHGNADQMFQLDSTGRIRRDADGQPLLMTSHTLNPVPFTIYDPAFSGEYRLSEVAAPGLSHVAATALWLLGFHAPDNFDRPLIAASS